jgi:hypothetical protein
MDYDMVNIINNLHILARYIKDKLDDRFIKEQTKDPNASKEDHIRSWFDSNSKINYDTDI